MAYEAEMITYSQKIFYYLLCHGALSDLDVGVNDLYRAYVEHEEIMNLVKNQAEIADCRIERYGTTIYLMPDIDNKYLGFTKADLKKELCKPNATDRDYYLAQFVILTLLMCAQVIKLRLTTYYEARMRLREALLNAHAQYF